MGHRRAVVILLSVVGMHSVRIELVFFLLFGFDHIALFALQRAVHVALDGQDLELAKIAVRRVPQTSEWRKRQLWKEIAKTAVSDVSVIMLFYPSFAIDFLHSVHHSQQWCIVFFHTS